MRAWAALASRLWRPPPPAATGALLDAREIDALAGQARLWPRSAASVEIRAWQAGDSPSNVLGRGLDFEEARPYAAGDDPRAMDWRSTARRGQPFVRISRDERRPLWHVVVDRRPAMRFGTRRRLKAAQAARLGVLLAHAAGHLGCALAASVWEEMDVRTDRHFPAVFGPAGLLPMVRAMAAPCPPLPMAAAGLAVRLRVLRARVPSGARLWVLSDGSGLDDEGARELAALAAAMRVHFLRIRDPAESELPRVGLAPFAGAPDCPPVDLDTDDPGTRRTVAAAWAGERLAEDRRLARCGLRAGEVASAEDELLGICLRLGGAA